MSKFIEVTLMNDSKITVNKKHIVLVDTVAGTEGSRLYMDSETSNNYFTGSSNILNVKDSYEDLSKKLITIKPIRRLT